MLDKNQNGNFESKITFEIPSNLDFDKLTLNNNFTLLLTDLTNRHVSLRNNFGTKDYGEFIKNQNSGESYLNENDLSEYQSDYERFVSDIWVGIILTLMISLSMFCIFSCYIYHKYQEWKINEYNLRQSQNVEAGFNDGTSGIHSIDVESLPSYTIVSGLPTYDDALDQMRKLNNQYIQGQQRPSIARFFSTNKIDQSSSYLTTHKSFNHSNKSDNNYTENNFKIPCYDEILYHAVPSYEEAIGDSIQVLDLQQIQYKIPSYEETLRLLDTDSNDVEQVRRLSIIELPSIHTTGASITTSTNDIGINSNFRIKSNNITSFSFSSLDELCKKIKKDSENLGENKLNLSINF